MNLSVLDLTDKDGRQEQLDQPQKCKFVVVGNSERLILVVGPVSRYKYHANLLEKLCDLEQMACFWATRPDQLQLAEVDWSVRGGGWLIIDIVERRIELSGSSRAYGRYHDDDIQQLISKTGFFIGFETILKV